MPESRSELKSRLKLFIPVIIFLLLALLLWRGLYLDSRTLPSVLIDRPLPDFRLGTVERPEQEVSKEDLLGEPFVLNVWGSYCLPCLQENPILMDAAENDGVRIVGVNYKDRTDAARAWLQDNGDPFALSVLDPDGRLGIDLGVYGAPETFVVDSRGIIRYKHIGVLDYESWETKIMSALRAIDEEQAAEL